MTTALFADAQDNDKVILEGAMTMLRPAESEASSHQRFSLHERMQHYGVPGVAIAVIQNGNLVAAQGFGVLQKGSTSAVNADTLFSAGSVSKVATATLIMRLQALGKLDVDTPVEHYLKSWQMPKHMQQGMNPPSTLRMILSHTAGFNIHGFADFLPGEKLPSVYDTLNGSGPAKHQALALLYPPGSDYRYSGGGYTLAQLAVTDLLGEAYPTIAETNLFRPLEMRRSSFSNPLPESTSNVAKAHNRYGRPTALPRGYEAMPEMGASGLWTSANDLSKLVIALIQSHRFDEGFIPQGLTADMMSKVKPGRHGIGPGIAGTAENRVFHHGGANDSYRAWMEGHLGTGNGLVILTNGTRGRELYREIQHAVSDTYGWQVKRPFS